MSEQSCLLMAPHECPDPELDVPPGAGEPQTAVLAGGCFWCTEAVFLELDGVHEVTSGYAGGSRETADYRSVCTGATGHAEAIRIRFDPQKITFGQLLKVFFSVAHDPTQLNRQGADRGTQYRSAIFYADEEQRRVAEAYIAQLQRSKAFSAPIVTTLEPLEEFYPAEDYHQDYAARNPAQPYIAHAALPKVEKVRKHYAERLRR
jgi:peptide-methionine (S)-S-oxide reductase